MRIRIGLAMLAAAAGLAAFGAMAPRTQAGNSQVTITKVVSGSNATTAGGSVTYTITVRNDGAASISLDCVTDDFPEGFSWDSNTGGYDPGPYGDNCEGDGWFFDGKDIAAGGSLSWSFIADVNENTPDGCYYNEATAYFNNAAANTGETAPVGVGEQEGPCGESSSTAPAIVRTATPTSTATPQATETELTEPATQTPVPPAAPTSAGAGVGAGITGPNTGTGGGASAGSLPSSGWLLAAAAVLGIAGAAVAAAGRRRA